MPNALATLMLAIWPIATVVFFSWLGLNQAVQNDERTKQGKPTIEAELEARGWQLDLLMITHHHHDHVGGVEALRSK